MSQYSIHFSWKPNREQKKARGGKMAEENEGEKSLVLLSPKEETPIRAVACLKRKEDMKRFEETEECFILGFDPSESLDLSRLSLNNKNSHDDDLSIVAEKGPVACRDYPHSRHLCLKFPFTTTPHASYCEMCYCYACDSAAPCEYWTRPTLPHCDANGSSYWKMQRNSKKILLGAESVGNSRARDEVSESSDEVSDSSDDESD